MKVERRFTRVGASPYEGIRFETRASEIRNPDGTVAYSMEDVLVPADWCSCCWYAWR